MNNRGLLAFAAGLVVGALCSWKYTSVKYKNIAQSEIDSVKEMFCVKKNDNDTEVVDESSKGDSDTAEVINNDESMYDDIVKDLGYSNEDDSDIETEVCVESNIPNHDGYLINPEEFGEFDDYNAITIEYFSDGKFSEEGIIIDDVESILGSNIQKEMNRNLDSVYIRNDVTKTDYEVVRMDCYYDEAYPNSY